MVIKINKKIGDATVQFEVDERDDNKAFAMLAFLTEPDYCWLKGFEESPIKWNVRKAKGEKGEFTFVERKARSVDGKWATSSMGEYKDGGYFWKKWEVYEPTQKSQEDEIPF